MAQALTLEYRKEYILSRKEVDDGRSDTEFLKDWLEDPENLALLGDVEHLRWNAYQRLHGWRTADMAQVENIAKASGGKRVKSDEIMIHPALVPLEDLPKVEEEADRIKKSVDPLSSPTRYVVLDREILVKLPEILNVGKETK